MTHRVRAIETWTRSYEDALAVQRGQVVRVHREDHEWPGWYWCVDAAGIGGWLPGSCLEAARGEARVVEDFDTVELSVAPGAVLDRLGTRDGWAWCRDSAGCEGWVPERVLGPA